MVASFGVFRNAKNDSPQCLCACVGFGILFDKERANVWEGLVVFGFWFIFTYGSIKGTSGIHCSFMIASRPKGFGGILHCLSCFLILLSCLNLVVGFSVGLHAESMVLMSSWTLMLLRVAQFKQECVSISFGVQCMKPNSLLHGPTSHFGSMVWMILDCVAWIQPWYVSYLVMRCFSSEIVPNSQLH